MARMIWKGAIAFGLVNIPVELYPGARSSEIDLDWIDKRDMAPVGIQRINQETGRPVAREDIVKGYKYRDGCYVILADVSRPPRAATGGAEVIDLVKALKRRLEGETAARKPVRAAAARPRSRATSRKRA